MSGFAPNRAGAPLPATAPAVNSSATEDESVAPVSDQGENAAEPEDAGQRPALPLVDDRAAASFDSAAESAFLGAARERGEPVRSSAAATAAVEEIDGKVLPPLDELVKRIPPDVREALDDLFRARFVSVKRVPRRALKT